MTSAAAPAQGVPQTELHRHLDVSIRLETLYELGQARGLVTRSTSLAAFRDRIFLREPMADLSSVLDKFTFFPKVLAGPADFERVGFEVAEDCWNEGTRVAELRYSPSFVTAPSGLSWDVALDGFYRGCKRAEAKYPGLRTGLICIASRDFGEEAAAQTVEFYLKNLERFVGVDLAGNEVNFPCRMFEHAFAPAVKAKRGGDKRVHITIHSGEASGPENMWEALELLGAERIGHGIRAVEDPKLVEHLREKNVCLEVCPTSNILTQCAPSYAEHTAARLMRAGVPVSINTDDPGVFAVSLEDEFRHARSDMGFSEADVARCLVSAYEARFV
ncbi:MAG: adenosine deaminase [Bdellovibrionales bacterium]|nr:adenosine deaminase [Bdellovibrionales bacterium]